MASPGFVVVGAADEGVALDKQSISVLAKRTGCP
jgi:hypothetical protein